MNYILNIHTATEEAIVNICNGEIVLASVYNNNPKQHAAFLHVAIKQLLSGQNISPKQISAVGVTKGPGSYTGIRVGMAAAKGLCFALGVPLITLNTLEVMALTLIMEIKDVNGIYGPMIDARRTEVFTALYDFNRKEILSPGAIILDEFSFNKIPATQKVYFSGSGSSKYETMNVNALATFYPTITISSNALAMCTYSYYHRGKFDDVAWSQPEYLKEFYTPIKENN